MEKAKETLKNETNLKMRHYNAPIMVKSNIFQENFDLNF